MKNAKKPATSKKRKQFLYCNQTDGGMDTGVISSPKEIGPWMYGWMTASVADRDKKLVKWMNEAEVGAMCEHRLGVMVRLKDIPR